MAINLTLTDAAGKYLDVKGGALVSISVLNWIEVTAGEKDEKWVDNSLHTQK